jgi:hypothetical protein
LFPRFNRAFLVPTARWSSRLSHGDRASHVLAFSRNLGRVNLCSLEWRYDHEIDPLDLLKGPILGADVSAGIR